MPTVGVSGIGESSFCTLMDQHARPNRTTPLQSVWSMALSAMMVECEPFIYLFIQCRRFTNISQKFYQEKIGQTLSKRTSLIQQVS